MPRLAIVSSHPIQYNAPVFTALAARGDLDVHVFFSWRGAEIHPDVGFGRTIAWDIPLTEGYAHTFVENTAKHPGTHHFMGLRNPAMCPAIETFRPDAVLVYGWASWTHLSVLRHFHRKAPILFRGDSTLAYSGPRWKGLVRKPALSWIYRHVDRALYVGQRNRDYFMAHGLPEDRLSWAPHSIDNDRFAADDERLQAEADAERASLGAPADAVVFLYAGKLIELKNVRLLIDSFRILRETRVEFAPHLIIVGAGPLEGELRARAAGIESIHFVGFRNQSEMPMTYRLGDVLALPSLHETWGLAVNEAMACGRPVIVSDRVGCCPDLAGDRAYSSVFEGADKMALARSLERWAPSRVEARAAGEIARKTISSWSTSVAAERIAAAVLMETRHV